MASDVNVTLSNFRSTGSNVSVAQRAVDVTVTWKDNAGQPRSSTTTENFPNVLADASLTAQETRDLLSAVALGIVRKRLGLDDTLRVFL